jgi:hypothetical protein
MRGGRRGSKPWSSSSRNAWEPPRPRFAHDQIVGLRIPFADVAVRARVKEAGGTWNPERRVWELRYGRAIALGLEDRIVLDAGARRGPSI